MSAITRPQSLTGYSLFSRHTAGNLYRGFQPHYALVLSRRNGQGCRYRPSKGDGSDGVKPPASYRQIEDDPIDGGKSHPRSRLDGIAARRSFYRLAPVRFCDRIAFPIRPEVKPHRWQKPDRTGCSATASRKARVSLPAAAGARYLDGQGRKSVRRKPLPEAPFGSEPQFSNLREERASQATRLNGATRLKIGGAAIETQSQR
jgi:hypothetical protein